MSTDLTVHSSGGLAEKIEWSRAMAPASLLPKQYQGNPGNLLFAVEYADALGIERINAITSIHVIEGKPSASSDLIAGLVRRAGHRLRITGDDETATAQIIRADDPEFTYEATWTLARARTAGLAAKAVWKNYPAAMLRARAITEVARMAASDALLGVVYTPEELGVDVDSLGAPVRPTGITAPPASGPDRLRAVLTPERPAEDVQDAEVVEPANDLITDAQMKALQASYRDAKITARDDKLAFAVETIGREIATSKDLTRAEASQVIDALKAVSAAPAPSADVEAEWFGGEPA